MTSTSAESHPAANVATSTPFIRKQAGGTNPTQGMGNVMDTQKDVDSADCAPQQNVQLSDAVSPGEWPRLPNTGFTCIEFPGYFKDPNNAIASLRGLSAIEKCRNGAGHMLPYYFRPNDPLSHPIYGDKVQTNNVLVKVTLKKRKRTDATSGSHTSGTSSTGDAQSDLSEKNPTGDDASSSPYTVEYVGSVQNTVRYHGLADFQYLPPKGYDHKKYQFFAALDRKEEVSAADAKEEAEEEEAAEPLHIPPPVFSRWDMPRLYRFRQNPFSIIKKDEQGRQTLGFKKSRVFVPRKSYADPTPSEPPEGLMESLPISTQPQLQAIYEKLQKLFQYRPVWSSWLLSLFFNKDERYCIKRLLPAVSYNMTSGAWRGLLIQYGYDPRQWPTAAQYQVMDIRLSKAQKDWLQARRSSQPSQYYPYRLKMKFRTPVESQGSRNPELEAPWEKLPMAPGQLFNIFLNRDHFRLPQMIFLQWADIKDDFVQRTVEAPGLTDCHPITGWLSKDSLVKLRIRVKQLVDIWFLDLQRNPTPIAPVSSTTVAEPETPTTATPAPIVTPILKSSLAKNKPKKSVMIVDTKVSELDLPCDEADVPSSSSQFASQSSRLVDDTGDENDDLSCDF